jgi:phasin
MTDPTPDAGTSAEKVFGQAKEILERNAAAAAEARSAMEKSYATATEAAKEYNLKLMEIARANLNATFDLALDVAQVRSPSEFVEVSSAHARKQFEALTQQTKELGELAQKIGLETGGPLKSAMNRTTDGG